MVIQKIIAAILDPATNIGTARWVALGVASYDAARHGVTLANGAVLLVLAGVDIAARYFSQPPPPPPFLPSPVPA